MKSLKHVKRCFYYTFRFGITLAFKILVRRNERSLTRGNTAPQRSRQMKKKIAVTDKAVTVEAQGFVYLPQAEVTNDMQYHFDLLVKVGYKPIWATLQPRNDRYGKVQDIWAKEVIASWDFIPMDLGNGLKVIALDVTAFGSDRYRRTIDQYLDNSLHIKTVTIVTEKVPCKWMIAKPLEGPYLSMKLRTQSSGKVLNAKWVAMKNNSATM